MDCSLTNSMVLGTFSISRSNDHSSFRSSHSFIFFKIGFLKISQKNTCTGVSFLINLQVSGLCVFLQNFLSKPSFKEHLRWLLLSILNTVYSVNKLRGSNAKMNHFKFLRLFYFLLKQVVWKYSQGVWKYLSNNKYAIKILSKRQMTGCIDIVSLLEMKFSPASVKNVATLTL